MLLTYRQLGEATKKMTDEQLDKPVQTYHGEYGEIIPYLESSHPKYNFSSSLVPANSIPGYKDLDPNQLVIYSDLSEEGRLMCERQHLLRCIEKSGGVVLKERVQEIESLVGKDVLDYADSKV